MFLFHIYLLHYSKYDASNPQKVQYYCKDCGKEITRGAIYCTVCSRKHSRKVEDRPSKEQLLEDFKELKSFVKVGNNSTVKTSSIINRTKQDDSVISKINTENCVIETVKCENL